MANGRICGRMFDCLRYPAAVWVLTQRERMTFAVSFLVAKEYSKLNEIKTEVTWTRINVGIRYVFGMSMFDIFYMKDKSRVRDKEHIIQPETMHAYLAYTSM